MAAESELKDGSELVDRIARRLHRELDLSCELDDLRAWGHQGLLEARGRFDASRGAKFSTFAFYRVRGAMLDGVRRQGFLPRRAYAKLKAFEATDAVAEPLSELPANPAADGTEARARELDDALAKISAAYIIASVGQDESEPVPLPDEQVARSQLGAVVRDGLALLPDKERTLLEAVYFDGATIEEAGGRLGLSKSWASRLHAKALERMRKQLAVLED
jgi:RNA polymerase sigma factor for flagellar operon FliA